MCMPSMQFRLWLFSEFNVNDPFDPKASAGTHPWCSCIQYGSRNIHLRGCVGRALTTPSLHPFRRSEYSASVFAETGRIFLQSRSQGLWAVWNSRCGILAPAVAWNTTHTNNPNSSSECPISNFSKVKPWAVTGVL